MMPSQGAEGFGRCLWSLSSHSLGSMGVVTIGDMAFAGSSALTELEIQSTVTAIDVGFIGEYSALRRLKVPSGGQTMGPRWADGFKDVTKVEHLRLVGTRPWPVVVAHLEGFGNRNAARPAAPLKPLSLARHGPL
jgi:hypothetical protein